MDAVLRQHAIETLAVVLGSGLDCDIAAPVSTSADDLKMPNSEGVVRMWQLPDIFTPALAADGSKSSVWLSETGRFITIDMVKLTVFNKKTMFIWTLVYQDKLEASDALLAGLRRLREKAARLQLAKPY